MSRYLVACDAGGTMSDVILVDEQGWADKTLDAIAEWCN